MKVQATLQLHGKTACGFTIPDSAVESLGGGRKPPVSVTINGYTYRTSIAFMGGEFLLGASAEVRQATGIKAGDTVDIEIVLDDKPREVVVPEDFKSALIADVKAKEYFDGLSFSNQRRVVWQINEAKTEDTRLKRIAKWVASLRDGKT